MKSWKSYLYNPTGVAGSSKTSQHEWKSLRGRRTFRKGKYETRRYSHAPERKYRHSNPANFCDQLQLQYPDSRSGWKIYPTLKRWTSVICWLFIWLELDADCTFGSGSGRSNQRLLLY